MLTAYAQKLLDRKAAAPAQSGRAVPAPVAPPVPLPAALADFAVNMTVSEVASYFRISADAVLLFRDSGEMDFLNVSPGSLRPTWRVTRASVAAFEAKRQTASAP